MAKKRKPRKIIEYKPELIKQLVTDNPSKLVLGCDPGSKNYGIALVGLVKDKPKVYANAVMMRPIETLITYNESVSAYKEELEHWLAPGVNGIIAERFQTRGNGGPLIELVSVMIGVMDRYDKPIKAIVASQWKNDFKRRFGLDLKDLYDDVMVQPHQLDASLIGIYGLEQGLGIKFDWDYTKVFRQVEKTSLIGTRKTRKETK